MLFGAARRGEEDMDAAILQALEKIRCPFLDVFFSIFTMLGEELIIAAVIAAVYVCFSKRVGEQALLTVMTASAVTTVAKGAVRRLRPYAAGDVSRVEIDNALVSTMDLDADMSFPSGHATATSGFFASLAIRIRRPLAIVLCSLFTLLVMLSRLYLGVHYPTDVLAGLAIGVASAFFWQLIYSKCYGARLYIYLGVALLTVPLLFFGRTATHSMFQISAITLATSLGLLIEDRFIRFTDTKKWLHRLLRLLVAVAVAAAVFLPCELWLPEGEWFSFLKYFLTLFAATTLAPLLIRTLKI